ncbi:response regulator [Niveibacterium sp. 24ML]|uniref:response regulator n=1 Tax=Niveibacterium sp. 24ML TaxID=2985512 RepID=UPI00226D5FA3|nr:HD domain-containing phosphohydrolase [Niveibacterium sp. 24ML]MCX9157480.1 response regulator [Niveibacterium sp. 24ML]
MTSPAMQSKDSPGSSTILIIDDQPENLMVLSKILQPRYRVLAARSGADAFAIAKRHAKIDLVLLDIMMPEMDGYEVLRRLHEYPSVAGAPVIFVSALSDEPYEEKGLKLGAVDYITKPIMPSIVLARVGIQLELKAARDALASQNELLEAKIQERTHALRVALETTKNHHAALKKTYFGTLLAISAITEIRGGDIGEHGRRVADLTRGLSKHFDLDESEAQAVFVASLVHDVGLIGASDDLLASPISMMNTQQRTEYHTHPSVGATALRKVEQLREVAEIIECHHEHFDGRGFPAGLVGLSIPIGARIIAVASDYDDLRSGKMTGKPCSVKQSFEFISDARGTRYDPRVVDALEVHLGDELRSSIIELRLSPSQLQEGMLVTRDLLHSDGLLLLSRGSIMTRPVIKQLSALEKETGGKMCIFVAKKPTQDAR